MGRVKSFRGLTRFVPILLSIGLIVVSCGPSLEDKARKQVMRDSASAESLMRKQDAEEKKIQLASAKMRTDSVRKEREKAQKEAQSRKDSIKAKDSTP